MGSDLEREEQEAQEREDELREMDLEDLQYEAQDGWEDAIEELNQRTGDEWYPDGRDDD